MRRAARTDANHREGMETLRQLGYSVHDTHTVGSGFVDFVAGRNGITILVEAIGTYDHPVTVREHEARRVGWKGGPWIIYQSRDDLLAQLAGVTVQ